MKRTLLPLLTILSAGILTLVSCRKNDSCEGCTGIDRPVIQVQLIPVGYLSEPKSYFVAASAGNKIVFAGGWLAIGAGYSGTADIYDITTNTWSTANLSEQYRQGMAAASVGNKIFFAGGGDNDNGFVTSRIDIYDVSTDTWSTAELSEPKEYLAAATIGNKVYFAGGGNWNPDYRGLTSIDIYDNATNTWTTSNLSVGRSNLSASAIGSKIYFAGGSTDATGVFAHNSIDIFDTLTRSWSTSMLQEKKNFHAAAVFGNKIFWAGGRYWKTQSTITTSDQVEIWDVNTGAASLASIIPKYDFSAAIKGDNIVFFTGPLGDGTRFDVYNSSTNKWSIGWMQKKINHAAIISVNNTIYVAGGYVNGVLSNEVWKLEF
jgi:hypothetical protein